jgi:predicted dehydrogenase
VIESASGRLRAGVIGLGWAGRQHMAAYHEAGGVELVALAGMEVDQLEVLGSKYGVELRYGDWRDLVDNAELDIVSNAPPTTLHAPIAVAAENADVARSMVLAAKDNDRVLEVSFNHRRRGDVQALKSIIEAGLLGKIYYAKAGWLRRQGIPGLGSWFTRAATAGGGPLMDIGVHMLDMSLHLLGEPNVRAATAATYAEFGPRGKGSSPYGASKKTGVTEEAFDVEDLSTAFLRLDDGATLLLESSWAQWIPHDQCYVAVYGSDGGASIEWGGLPGQEYRSLRIWTELDGIPAELQPTVPPDGGHAECVLDFIAEVKSGDYSSHRGEEAMVRAQVVDACYASAGKGTEVLLG